MAFIATVVGIVVKKNINGDSGSRGASGNDAEP